MNGAFPIRRLLWNDCRGLTVAATVFLLHLSSVAQPVMVTLKLDKTAILVGETTTLHVLAQISSNAPPAASGIFSWDIDLMTLSESVVQIDYGQLRRPVSDNNPHTSSSGVTQGLNRLGIYDTFLTLPGAGRSAPVELLSVPVTGLALGTATFQVRAGTGVPQLSADFLVSASNSSAPLVGADYSSAVVALDVQTASTGIGSCQPTIAITLESPSTGKPLVTISFQPCAGIDHFVEFADTFGGTWTSLPGAPHNSGTATDVPSSRTRFYRVRISN